MKFRDIPNAICIMRIILVAPVVAFILHGDYLIALLLFVIAGISDGIDGYLARHFGWQSSRKDRTFRHPLPRSALQA